MHGGAKLAVTDLRQGARFPVSYSATCEHRELGDILLRASNVSKTGFLVEARSGVNRGDRLMVSLPAAVRLEAFCIWTSHQRAGFQFERPIWADDFARMMDALIGAKLTKVAA